MPKNPAERKGGWLNVGTISDNRKARFNYEIVSDIEAGIALWGSEVKALRLGRCALSDSYAALKGEELFLINMHIGEYTHAPRQAAHPAKRERKLLLKKRELKKLIGLVRQDGMTLVPLRLYFNDRGIAKVKLAIAKGKKQVDKRETIKRREWERNKARILKRE